MQFVSLNLLTVLRERLFVLLCSRPEANQLQNLMTQDSIVKQMYERPLRTLEQTRKTRASGAREEN